MIRIALIDGPLDGPASPARSHAAAMVRAIRRNGAPVEIRPFPVFDAGLSTSLARLLAALDAAAAEDPAIVHCSLGLPRLAPELAAALDRLLAAGTLVVAARPARGPDPVWPAAHPGVVAVQGDARCGPADCSALDPAQRWFGACPALPPPEPLAGASVAAAHFTGLLAFGLARGLTPDAVLAGLSVLARFQGRERRGAATPAG